MFLHELALEMGKSVREMTTGVPGMSAHELCVEWPAFFEVRRELQDIQRKLDGAQSSDQFDREHQRTTRTFGGGGSQ